MKKILLIIPFLFSNYLYSANVSGYCYLQNQTDHSGIKVLFEAVTPSATTDSTYTNTDGSYNIGLTGGIYSINFSKDDYYPYTMPGNFTFSDDSYTLESATLTGGGTTQFLNGSISGILTSDVLYLVDGDITVAQEDMLMIEPGTTIEFLDDYRFDVHGDFYALGEEGNEITFTSGRPLKQKGDWNGINFDLNTLEGDYIYCYLFFYESDCNQYEECSWVENFYCYDYDEFGNCIIDNLEQYCDGGEFYIEPEGITVNLEYVTIEYAKNGVEVYNSYDSSNFSLLNSNITLNNNNGLYASDNQNIIISNSSFTHNADDGIRMDQNDGNGVLISNNIISNNEELGFQGNNNNFTFEGNTVSNNGYHGVYSRYGEIYIINNTVENNSDRGMWIQQCSNSSLIEGNIVKNNGVGIQLYLTNGIFKNNTVVSNNSWGFDIANIYDNYAPSVINNTITNNGNGIWMAIDNSISSVTQNIITNNNYTGVQQYSTNNTPYFTYNNVWNNGTNYTGNLMPGLGENIINNHEGYSADTYLNISEDPLFVFDGSDQSLYTWQLNDDDTVTFYLIPQANWGSPIFWGDNGNACTYEDFMSYNSSGYYEITVPLYYCDGTLNYFFFYEDGYESIGDESIDFITNPIGPEINFGDLNQLDFNLTENSPCIDSGNPQSEFDLDGSYADIGAYPYYNENISAPSIDITASQTSGFSPLPVEFSYTNTGGPITSYLWSFGDGTSSTNHSPVHNYSSDVETSYTVSLTVEGPGGSDYIVYENLISVVPMSFPPSCDFSADTVISFGEVQFTSQGSGTIDTYYWDFGDGNTSSEQNPTHTYESAGTYTVSLTVEGPNGNDTEVKNNYIQILSPETVYAGFEIQTNEGIAPLTISFTNTSIGTIEGYLWDFGNGETSDNENPVYTYLTPGDYTITLTVYGMINDDTFSQEISVLSPSPTIITIADIDDDQGGWVYVSFNRSGHDTDTPNRSELYTVERNDNDVWTAVLSLAAYGQDMYQAYVPTLSDSTSSSDGLSSFRIIAAMDEGNWISNELSGYSVDNIAPVAPQNVNASYLDSESIEISWTENEEQDLGYYKVFRDITSTFDANEENFIESTNQNQFIDNNLNGETYYYKVRAIDTHDNQSESSVFVFAQSLTGDINFDFTVNVLDIVALVDIVIDVFENDYNPTDAELGLLDIYPDGLLNVIDIVGLVNIVLNQ